MGDLTTLRIASVMVRSPSRTIASSSAISTRIGAVTRSPASAEIAETGDELASGRALAVVSGCLPQDSTAGSSKP